VPDWIAQDGTVSTRFAHSLSSAGDINNDGYDDIIVGDQLQDVAFVYLGSSSVPDTMPDLTYRGSAGNGALGSAVSTAGDVNHDGYADVLVGDPMYWKDSMNIGGRVFLYPGWNFNN
jgi:hypothetical protein